MLSLSSFSLVALYNSLKLALSVYLVVIFIEVINVVISYTYRWVEQDYINLS